MGANLLNLTKLVDSIARSSEPESMMRSIVERLSALMKADVCSLYLFSPSQDCLILAASHGLSGDAIGKIKLHFKEGLVGHIAANLTAINLKNAQSDARFRLIPEADEKLFKAFLGVPLIHLRKLIGVLVVQGTQEEKYSSQEESFLITVASQLAGALLPLQQSSSWLNVEESVYKVYKGISSVKGRGIGKLWVVHPSMTLSQVNESACDDPLAEKQDFLNALQGLEIELESRSVMMSRELPAEISALFKVYQMMLASPELLNGVNHLIDQGYSATWALKCVIEKMAGVFQSADDPYLKARSEDFLNLGQQLLNSLLNQEHHNDKAPEEPLILAGKMISITDIAEFPLSRIQGIICTRGSALSHTAILANALGIPTIMGAESLKPEKHRNQQTIIDGSRGECIINPPEILIREYQRIISEQYRFFKDLERIQKLPAITLDGIEIELLANTGLMADVTPGLERGAQGIGLYRSEIPFMIQDYFPTENEQELIYRKVLSAYAPLPVCMRTLDIGGDKQLPYFSIEEENPYLGWRGIRFSLDNTQLLITQLRAMLRADMGNHNLKLLIPMVSRVDEIKSIRHHLHNVQEDLVKEGYSVKMPTLGIMIEVPSSLFILSKLAPYIDFVSIGSNDLTQYLLAVDRNNAKVSSLYDPLHPAVIQALQMIHDQCRDLKLPVSVCGEVASDPAAVLLLMSIGYRSLSLSSFNIPRIKHLIRSVHMKDVSPLIDQVKSMHDEKDIRTFLEPFHADLFQQHKKG